MLDGDFPGGPVVENLPCNARDTGSIPDLGRSHMPWGSWADGPQLRSPHSGPCEPQLLKPVYPRACAPQQERSLQWEACVPQLENSPHSLKLEKACLQQEDPAQSKIKKKKASWALLCEELARTSWWLTHVWLLAHCLGFSPHWPLHVGLLEWTHNMAASFSQCGWLENKEEAMVPPVP